MRDRILRELADIERAEAMALLKAPDLLDRILADFATCGVVGEETNKLVAERKRELEEGHPARLRHVTTESERVRAAVDALRAHDLDRLGEIFREGQESLRVDFEASIPELDRLVELAYEHGAVAARMTGGGFGGAIVALVDADRAQPFADAVLGAYGMRGRAYVCAAADGAREL